MHKSPEKGNNEETDKCRNFSKTPSKCSMSTDTEDLTKQYQNTGTQPPPWGSILDLEEIMNNDPVENVGVSLKVELFKNLNKY